MARFPVAEAQIVALFMEAIAYGIYLVTLGLCVRALFWPASDTSTSAGPITNDRIANDYSRGGRKRYNWPLVVVAALMCVFATCDVAFGLRHNLDAFIFYTGPGGAGGEFEDISYWVNVMKTVDVQMMTLIGDGMLIYRCLVIYAHNRLVVALPVLLWLANAACSAIIIYITSTLRTDALLSVAKLTPFLTAFLVITLVTNVLTTGLIVWRIWRIDRQTSHLPSPLPPPNHLIRLGHSSQTRRRRRSRTRLAHVIRILIESGFLYTSLVLVTFGTELAGSNAIYGVSDVMVIAIGISFNLIIIRVSHSSHSPHSSASSSYPFPSSNSPGAPAPSIPLHFRSPIDTELEMETNPGVLVSSVVDDDDGGKGQWEAV